MRLDQEGTGAWKQAGQARARITHVTLGGNPTQPIGIEFTFRDGTRRALAATLEHKDGEWLILNIVSVDNAGAKGTLKIRYGPKHSILTLSARGQVSGHGFRIQFENGP